MNIKHILMRSRRSALVAAIVVAAACSSSSPPAPGGAVGEEDIGEAKSALSELSGIPLPGKYLSASLPFGDSGLIPPQYLRADGTPPPGQYPPLDPNNITPMDETEAYYAHIDQWGWVPQNLREWKDYFQASSRDENQSVADYRSQPNAHPLVVYYNKNELGLGRELGCGDWFDEGPDPAHPGARLQGVACFVTNYGTAFGDMHSSLFEAIKGKNAKNTVAIVYRPSLAPNYQVQFYAFDSEGNRLDWAQLDTLGPRRHPELCINCHGGTYDKTLHLVRDAHFLPLDPNTNVFNDTQDLTVEDLANHKYPLPSPTSPTWASRQAQEEDIRRINQIALGPLTPAGTHLGDPSNGVDLPTQQLSSDQRNALKGLYNQGIDTPGQPSLPPDNAWVPPNWNLDQTDADVYTKVVKPYCVTCHNAVEGSAFQRSWDFYNGAVLYHVCTSGTYDMPQAQATMTRFWSQDGANWISINGVLSPSPGDALLKVFGKTRSDCPNFYAKTSCGGIDSACGDAHSGMACDANSYLCAPNISFAPPDPGSPTGVCRLPGGPYTSLGSRDCPKWEECRQSSDTPPGYDGACFSCGRQGQPVCQGSGNSCFFPAVDHGDGVCHACDEGGPCDNTVYREYNGPYYQPEYAGGATRAQHLYTLNYNEGWQYNFGYTGQFTLPRVHVAGGHLHSPPDTAPFYRCNLGVSGHLYTTSASCEGASGASNEGNIGAIGAFDTTQWACKIPGTKTLWRLSNTLDGDHFYTADENELWQFIEYWDAAHHTWPWQWEGIVGCVW